MTNNWQRRFDKGWYSPSGGHRPDLVAGRGYAVNIAGTQLVDFTGVLHSGNYPVPLARNSRHHRRRSGWHLVGNPYPAPLDYALVLPADRRAWMPPFYVF